MFDNYEHFMYVLISKFYFSVVRTTERIYSGDYSNICYWNKKIDVYCVDVNGNRRVNNIY